MKTIKYLIILATFLPLKSMATADSTAKSYFYVAKQHLESMLMGKEQMTYEEAIYQIENAWWEGGIDQISFKTALDNHTDVIRKLITLYKDSVKMSSTSRDMLETKEQKLDKYKKALSNYAIYNYITKPLINISDNAIIYQKPFLYSKQDPLGTIDWTNTQVVHLINTNTGNCFALASLFKIFSERLHSEANLTTAPGHIYIRHADDKGTKFNVELSSHSFPGTGTLETLTYTPDEATKNGIALRELDLKQSIALCLVYLAKGYEYKFGIKEDPFMLACAEKALQYDDHNLNAMLLKAEVMESRLIDQNKTIKQLSTEKEFIDYQKWVAQIFSYGYREMPFEMKNIMIRGWTRDTIITLSQQDHTPSRLKHPTLKDTRYAGISWGLFDEEIKTKPLERFGNSVFDTKKKIIIAFLKDDILYNHYNFDPVVFAWNVDPLAKSFAGLSPYAFAQNSPIAMVDREGMHGEIVISKTGTEKEAAIKKIDVNVLYLLTTDQEKRQTGEYSFVDYARTQVKATYGRKTFEGSAEGKAYNASFNITIKAGLTVDAMRSEYRSNPVSNYLSVNQTDVNGKRVGTSASSRSINYATSQHETFPNPFAHEVSHTLGERGDMFFGNDYMSNYTGSRQVQDAEVQEFLAPAIRLANQFEGKSIIIRFFNSTDKDGNETNGGGAYNTYRVYDPSSGTYLKSETVPQINPQSSAPATK